MATALSTTPTIPGTARIPSPSIYNELLKIQGGAHASR